MKTKFRIFHKAVVLSVMMLLSGLIVLPIQAQTATATPEPVIAKWDQQSPFTIMVAGIDRRPGDGNILTVRTDAIMLVHVNPAEQTIGILHIPRDLFFALPPTSTGETLPLVRVNTLLLRGEGMQPGNGAYYMMDTIQYNFGMYIDAYVLFDFQAFTTIVDALGGIDITTTYNIADPSYPDMNGGYDPFYLSAGEHHLDGETALKFARTRHGDNDYLRGYRQLQVISAIGDRASSPDMLPQLLIMAPSLFQSLQSDVYTDLTLTDAINLGNYVVSVPKDHIHTGGVNEEYIVHTVNEGESVAIPDREKLIELLTEVFGEGYGG
ncbi:MAG TPA: LCP family protein [Phototrophicaceae bacterium]|jgi:LCP family protein required for cell wall assembly|nr:LCP family protein [Phototrophicaceae bacterium]